MVIIGINSSHNATACLLVDGKIIACISEERLTRVKNQSGLPVLAIKEILKIGGLTIEDVDYLVLNTLEPRTHLNYATFEDEGIPWRKGKKKNVLGVLWKIKEDLYTHFPDSRKPITDLLDYYYDGYIDPKLRPQLLKKIEKEIGISKEKVLNAEHHVTHFLPALLTAKDFKTKPQLLFTLDSLGDKLCATVSTAKNGKIKRIASTVTGNSIGDLYTQVTAYLGMKMGEHEYKIMGLAAYSSEKHYKALYEKLRELAWVNDDLTLQTKFHSHMFYKVLERYFSYERFDNVAGAVQKLTEEVLMEWVSKAIKKTGISNVVLGGGVFMNVKANQKILELPEVKSLTIMPTSSDESTAIGAALSAYLEKGLKNDYSKFEPITSIYFGGEFSDDEIKRELDKARYRKLKVRFHKNIEQKIAELLSKGEVVARAKGRMEWGARALGNRSILAHPSNLEIVNKINEQIKSRDFWMPFAPSMLDSDISKYVKIKKPIKAPYMSITFDSTIEGQEKFRAAMHQYDKTLRPQAVYKDWNPDYYKLIQEFKKITGIGGVLNTSFNLHGFPIVYSPEDALFVLENSGLKFLAIGSFLVEKEK